MARFGLLMSLAMLAEKVDRYGVKSLLDGLERLNKKKATTERNQLYTYPAFVSLTKMCQSSKTVTSPKLARLSVILDEFFRTNPDSRAIIFTDFRNVAQEICEHIKGIPGVRSSAFTGKASTDTDEGLSESHQLQIVSMFRDGRVNCIVATCVGEDGLDIGEVDLIVCYDIQSSPIRNVQRIGRTGREGKVIFLLAEGSEEQKYIAAESKKETIREMLTKDIKKFKLYRRERPFPLLPTTLECIGVRCTDIDNGHKEEVDKEAFLKKEESKEIEKLSNLKYKPLSIQQKIIGTFKNSIRSFESDILSSCHPYNIFLSDSDSNSEAEAEIEEEDIEGGHNSIVEELHFLSESSVQTQIEEKNEFFIYLSDSDVDVDPHILEVNDRSISFLTDSSQ